MINEAVKEPECQTVQGMVACLNFYFTACPNCAKADNIYSMGTYPHAAAKH